HLGNVFFAEEILAARGPVEAAEQVEQGRFTGSGWAHQGDEIALGDGQGHAPQGTDDDRFQVVVLDQVDDRSDRWLVLGFHDYSGTSRSPYLRALLSLSRNCSGTCSSFSLRFSGVSGLISSTIFFLNSLICSGMN